MDEGFPDIGMFSSLDPSILVGMMMQMLSNLISQFSDDMVREMTALLHSEMAERGIEVIESP